MATIKYTDSKGQEHFINNYKINNVIIQQEKGQSTTDVMSQKSVTDELNEIEEKINSIDITDQLVNYFTKEEINEMWCGLKVVDYTKNGAENCKTFEIENYGLVLDAGEY